MTDLQDALDKARKLHETLAYAKGAQMSGGDPAPILADAATRLVEVSNALGYFADPIDGPSDEAPAPALEREIVVGADYRFVGESGQFYTPGKFYRVRRVDPDGMFVMDDDCNFDDQACHYWNAATLRKLFEAVDDDVAMAAVEGISIVREAAE